jgi:hypothetical protein
VPLFSELDVISIQYAGFEAETRYCDIMVLVVIRLASRCSCDVKHDSELTDIKQRRTSRSSSINSGILSCSSFNCRPLYLCPSSTEALRHSTTIYSYLSTKKVEKQGRESRLLSSPCYAPS